MTTETSLAGPAGTDGEPGHVAQGVRRLVARLAHVEPATLSEGNRLYADLGLQSVKVLELLTAIERELGVDVHPADLGPGDLETVGSLIVYLTGN